MTVVAIEIDAQCSFSELCPEELPVAGALSIVSELNFQASLSDYRIVKKLIVHVPIGSQLMIAKMGDPLLMRKELPLIGNCIVYQGCWVLSLYRVCHQFRHMI